MKGKKGTKEMSDGGMKHRPKVLQESDPDFLLHPREQVPKKVTFADQVAKQVHVNKEKSRNRKAASMPPFEAYYTMAAVTYPKTVQ
jgi:hypothetical protein